MEPDWNLTRYQALPEEKQQEVQLEQIGRQVAQETIETYFTISLVGFYLSNPSGG